MITDHKCFLNKSIKGIALGYYNFKLHLDTFEYNIFKHWEN